MIALTVTYLNGNAQGSQTRYFNTEFIENLRPITEGNTATAARFEYRNIDESRTTFQVSETCAATAAAITSDRVLSGAETTANKNASDGYAGLSLYKLQLVNNANTYTSTVANTNTAARAYTLPDVAGGILVGAKIATGALVAGVRTVTVTGASTGSTAVVMTVALGGTVAAGGYKVACTANTVTITALQVDGTTTETSCTSTVQGICIL